MQNKIGGWVRENIHPFCSLYNQRGMRKCKMKKEYNTKGKHIIADCWGVKSNVLDDFYYLKFLLEKGIQLTGANILDECEHKFEPNGVTILHLLSESHASIHTYPDKGYIALDMYTCGEHIDTQRGIDHILDVLRPEQVNGVVIERGNIDGLFGEPYIYKYQKEV
jgi:S-adenosylmethionine decarboxylase